MNKRNYLTVFFLSLVYFFSTYLERYFETFVFWGLPIVFAILAYNLTVGGPWAKVTVAGTTPIVSLVWVLIFPASERYWAYVLLHCGLIWMIIVPMIEIFEDTFRTIKNHLKKVFRHLKSRNVFFSNVRNCVIVLCLSLAYFYSLFLDQYSIALVSIGLPALFAILTYNLATGIPLIKKTVTALIPVASLVWALILPEVENYLFYALLHLILISMVITPIIERYKSAYRLIQDHLDKALRRFKILGRS